jgi:putative exosortase-associated protein (TIGR04073 family)
MWPMRGQWAVMAIVTALLLCVGTGTAQAADAQKEYGAGDKFVRGLVNIVTAPWEIPARIRKRTDGDNTVRGWSLGTVHGIGFATARVVTGAFEVLTFPMSGAQAYAPVLEPEYAWEADE